MAGCIHPTLYQPLLMEGNQLIRNAMNSEKFDLKTGTMPTEFVPMTEREQYEIDGGSRTNAKQKAWFDRMADAFIAYLVGGSGAAAVAAI